VEPVSGFGEPLAGGVLDGVLEGVLVGVEGVVLVDVDDVSLHSGSMCSVRSNRTAARAPSRPLSLRMPAVMVFRPASCRSLSVIGVQPVEPGGHESST